jgi:predicted nuclease of predicted toxin-antitoxin system
MSREIHKKAFAGLFEEVKCGNKTFDVRVADFACRQDDILVLDEVDETSKQPTGRSIRKKVGYVLKTKDLDFYDPQDVSTKGYQVMSLLEEDTSL